MENEPWQRRHTNVIASHIKNPQNTDVHVTLGDIDIAFVQKIDVLGVCIDGKLNFNEHVRRICSKVSAQISALQRLTGLIDYPSRKAIYTSFIASNLKTGGHVVQGEKS